MIDVDDARLTALGSRFDVSTYQGNGASRRTLQEIGIQDAELFIACTSRDEVNIIASMFARALAPDARTIARTTDVEYLEVWHERQLDVDFIVSSERDGARRQPPDRHPGGAPDRRLRRRTGADGRVRGAGEGDDRRRRRPPAAGRGSP